MIIHRAATKIWADSGDEPMKGYAVCSNWLARCELRYGLVTCKKCLAMGRRQYRALVRTEWGVKANIVFPARISKDEK